jgi:muramoyltetrapeptide carboxypeptidase
MTTPPYLTKGDHVAIMCIAGKTNHHTIAYAVEQLQSWGLHVTISSTVGASQGSLGGPDSLRSSELQQLLDNPAIKAIFSARGGYGSTRIIDHINYSNYQQNPKWLIGFSDITALLSHANNLGIEAIHGPMPKMWANRGAKKALATLKKILMGKPLSYSYKAEPNNLQGQAQGQLTGGNLCILAHCIGSASQAVTQGKILFIEEIDEPYYNIDRMLVQLKRAGMLAGLAALIVGQFTNITQTDNPFGQNLEQIILEHCAQYGYPIVFNFPAGHVAANYPLIMGRQAQLYADSHTVQLIFDK